MIFGAQVFLRLLKRTFSVHSELLQLLLAALSGILTVSYGFLCAALLFGLLAVINKEGLGSGVPYLNTFLLDLFLRGTIIK